MKRALCMGLALLLAALTGMPSLAQKRLPAPRVYFDGEVVNNNWLKHGNSGSRQFLEARQNGDHAFAVLLHIQWWSRGTFGNDAGPFWCLRWVFSDRDGITKSGKYTWRITVTRKNKKSLKYVGAETPTTLHHWKYWGKEGWQNFDPIRDTWHRWDDDGNKLPDQELLWCGLDGKQNVRTRVQLIDQHGKPAGKKSKILNFKLGALPTS
ncbi:MAG: hypothetical protein OXN94_16915 [Chloroflexota bacterium]|nr:hypothetical protein [Chloroflexota bacterium]